MGEVFEILIISLISVPLGLLLGCGSVYVFNHMPAKWLCDYGEQPDSVLEDKSRQRISGMPYKFIFSALFIALGIYFGVHDYVFGITAIFEIWLLLMIGIADKKYMIIPDQFVIFLALFAIPLAVYRESMADMIYGMLIGGGTMLLISLIGKIVSGKEALGFGDVKLMAAIGLSAGLRGTAVVLVIMSLLAAGYLTYALARRKVKKGDAYPLGPFISLAMTIYLFAAASGF